jgi:hypothetical protein
MCGATRAGGNQVAITQQKLMILLQSYILDLYKLPYLNGTKALLFTAQSVLSRKYDRSSELACHDKPGPVSCQGASKQATNYQGSMYPTFPQVCILSIEI